MPALSRREIICTACVLTAAACTPDPIGTGPVHTGKDNDTGSGDADTDTDINTARGYPCEVPAGAEAEGWIRLPLAEHPELNDLYGSAVISIGGKSLNVAKVFDDCWVAMERPCTHEGALVEYRAARNQFVCPRHGAIYAFDGSKVSGPQPRGLVAYPCAPRDGDLWVKLT